MPPLLVIIPIIVILLLVFPTFTFGSGKYEPTVEIIDDAHLFQTEPLKKKLEKIKFRQPTHVAIITFDSIPNSHLDVALNDAVLKYGRENINKTAIPWISQEDANYWSDDLFILAVAPNDRFVGTYFGENIKVPQNIQDRIQASTKDDFRAGNWAGGIVQGVQSAASYIGAPASYKIVLPPVIIIIIAIAIMLYMSTRKKNIEKTNLYITLFVKEYTELEEAFLELSFNELEELEVNNYTSKLNQRIRKEKQNMNEYNKVLSTINNFSNSEKSSIKKQKKIFIELNKIAGSVLSVKGVNENIKLLVLREDWIDAWDNEIGLTYENLSALDGLVEKVNSSVTSLSYTNYSSKIDSALEIINKAPSIIDQLTFRLKNKKITPVKALETLEKLDNKITFATDELVRVLVRDRAVWNQGKYDSANRLPQYGGYYSRNGKDYRYNPYYSMRVISIGNAIAIDSYSYNDYHNAGSSLSDYKDYSIRETAKREAARRAAESRSSSGYSSGSGFSGAGSSSRF